MSRRINKPDTQADIDLRACLKACESFVVVAGAGSGKTTSLIKALKYIDETEGKKMRQEGKRIACITYTTTAEREILDDVGHDTLFHVSTIHSFLWELVRPFQPDIKAWVISKIDKTINKLIAEKGAFSTRVRQSTRDKNEADTLKYQEMGAQINQVNQFNYETGSNYLEGVLGHADIITLAPEIINSSRLLQGILAEKYPYFFIDESQDTVLPFIEAMKTVDRNVKKFCLGFFGDPMQKIYMSGAGAIEIEADWKQINKPENFRCSTNVLNVINQIRKPADNLEQIGGRTMKVGETVTKVDGSAYLFLLQADEDREVKIDSVRAFLAKKNNDPLWLAAPADADLRILVLEHRMAAKRLGFEQLFSLFNDGTPEHISAGFKEGTHWSLQPFLKFTIQLNQDFQNGNHFEVIELLRKFCPRLQKQSLRESKKDPNDLLKEIKQHVVELVSMLNGEHTIGEILYYIEANQLFHLDDRFKRFMHPEKADEITTESEHNFGKIDEVMARYFETPVKQVIGYQDYMLEESAYSTQHSIKGSEFQRVLVILDDEEGNSNFYSYNKLFGISELSERDKENEESGNDNTPARTRRLLYVCCSRALTDLAVILFVENPQESRASIEGAQIFPVEDIKYDEDLR